jgi:hypothetical protein
LFACHRQACDFAHQRPAGQFQPLLAPSLRKDRHHNLT